MDPAAAALSADLACVLKAFDRSPVRAGEHAVVLGAGAMGLLWTRLLSVAGATVTAVDPHPDRRERARALGAAEVLDSGAFEESVGRGERRSEAVVDAVGTPQAWEIALRAAAPGGRVHLFGSPAAGARAAIDTARLHRDELLLVGSFHHTPYHFAEALRGLAQGFVDPSVVVPERVPLAHLPAFLLRTFQGGGPPRAAVVP
jgi:L-iditol 2-dehydrogenase